MSLGRRMPWICDENYCSCVFTTADYDPYYFGTIICGSLYDLDQGLPAPWFNSNHDGPGIVWYWMREGQLELQAYCIRNFKQQTKFDFS